MRYFAGSRTGLVFLAAALFAIPAVASTSRIYVTNRAGTTVEVIDPQTDKVIQTISGIEVPQSVHFSPDGSRIYLDEGSRNLLHVIDRKTGKILKSIPIGGHTGYVDDIAVTKDGKQILVCIRATPGALDFIDTTTLERVKTIPFESGLHDIEMTEDGKYAVVGSPEGKVLSVIDVERREVVWDTKFNEGVMTFTIENRPQGAAGRVFVNLEDLNGFAVVDFAKHAEVARITLPDKPTGFTGVGSPSHGIRVAPDGRTLWVNSKPANSVFVYSLPDLKLVGRVAMPELNIPGIAPIGAQPDWITFTPDSKKVYITNAKLRSVSVIDAQSLKLVTTIPVGEVPERINTLDLP